MSSSPTQVTPRLHTLPTQVEAAFWLISLVILATLFGGLVGGSPIWMWPIVLTILILPLRAVLALPGREVKRQDVVARQQLEAEGVYERLQTAIDQLATQAGFHQPIRLLISRRPRETRATGSWRRHYILLGAQIARQLDADLRLPEQRDKARALLGHEIGHLLHRDVQRIGYTRELLRACFVWLPWWMLFLIGWLGAAYLLVDSALHFNVGQIEGMTPELQTLVAPFMELSPQARAEILEKMETISFALIFGFIINALWPILTICFVLWLFYWRRMVRVQEYYADQLAADLTQNEQSLLYAFGRYPGWINPAVPDKNPWQRLKSAGSRLAASLSSPLFSFSGYGSLNLALLHRRFVRWFALHPTYRERAACLKEPAQLHRDWFGVAGAITALVVTLNVLLITPLISYHLMSNIAHFATLAIFLLLSTWLLPFMISGEPFKPYLVRMLLLIFGIRAVFALVDRAFMILLALVAPTTAGNFINYLILAMARYSRPLEELPVQDPFLFMLTNIPLYLAYQVIIPPAAVVFMLFLYYQLNHDLFRHMAVEDQGQMKWRHWHWFSVIALSISVTTLVLIPVADLLGGTLSLSPARIFMHLAGLLAGLSLLVYRLALVRGYQWKPT
jgi:Zn-dependent protease with chaperone function